MRRRLDLGAALVARPPVLFLDEPTTGLDPRSRLGLWQTIEDRVAGGTTVLLTTQYLDEADRLADSIAVIDDGEVIAEGTSDELKSRVGGEKLEVTLEPPDARRRVHGAHRPHRGTGRGGRAGGGGGVSARSATVSDTLVLAQRNLMRIPRQPDLLIAYTIQPVMFVLLFVFVFGGAIQT